MTDITEQDLRDAREWAEDFAEMFKYDNEVSRETRAAVNYILATVDAPAPTLAEEIMHLPDYTMSGDHCLNDCYDHANALASRAEQIEQERDYWKDYALDRQREVERLTAERVTEPSLTINDGSMTPDPADVKPGETWIVDTERYGRAVAFRSEDGTGSPWRFASEISTGRLLDCAITLVSRLVPAPRQITTREELDALPEGSIIREHVDSEALQKDGNWYGADCGELHPDDVPLPATVLWEPEVAS